MRYAIWCLIRRENDEEIDGEDVFATKIKECSKEEEAVSYITSVQEYMIHA